MTLTILQSIPNTREIEHRANLVPLLGRPLRPVSPDAGLIGCACVAYCSSGRFASLAEAATALAQLDAPLEPRPEHRDIYEERFSAYRRAQQLVADWHQPAIG